MVPVVAAGESGSYVRVPNACCQIGPSARPTSTAAAANARAVAPEDRMAAASANRVTA